MGLPKQRQVKVDWYELLWQVKVDWYELLWQVKVDWYELLWQVKVDWYELLWQVKVDWYCATCSPACVILYRVTGSCKGPIDSE